MNLTIEASPIGKLVGVYFDPCLEQDTRVAGPSLASDEKPEVGEAIYEPSKV